VRGIKKFLPTKLHCIIDTGDSYHEYLQEKRIYVCPDCGTLKIEI
jgi:acetone carboxylase gamma subunit